MTLQRDKGSCTSGDDPATYQVCALHMRSSRPIPGLVSLHPTSEVDLDVQWDAELSWPEASRDAPRLLWHESASRDQGGEPNLRVWMVPEGALFHLRYRDGSEFLVDGRGTKVWATWSASLTFDDACGYLLGAVLGLVLRFRGITCLHASAIDIGNRAIAIAGAPGAGKSTTAAIFAKSGYRVLSDDVVALADHGNAFVAQSAYPRLGLWSDSVEALFGMPDALPEQTPTWNKCYWDLTQSGDKFQPGPLPLLAVYILGERQITERAPFVETLSARTALTQLIENTYVSYLLDRTMSSRDLDVLARLATNVPVRRVVPHDDFQRLPRLRDAILRDVEGLAAGELATAGSLRSAVLRQEAGVDCREQARLAAAAASVA